MNDKAPGTDRARPMVVNERPFGWLRDMDRFFEDFFAPARGAYNLANQFAPLPAIELVQTDTGYRLSAELPGMAPEDVDITVDNGVLTLAGEKKVEAERQQGGVTHSERRYGAFSRQIRLPADVRPDAISASFKDGVLTVTMARQASAAESGRKIPIDQA